VPSLRASIVVALCLLGGRESRAAGSSDGAASSDWRFTLFLGTTAVASGNPRLFPFPGVGAGALVEWRHFGLEGAIHGVPFTYCQYGEVNQACGSFWLWDLAPRFTVFPRSHWSPYLSVRLQLTEGDRITFGVWYHGSHDRMTVPAIGPRLGVRYRGGLVGWYLEGGPSFMVPLSTWDCTPLSPSGCGSWSLAQVSTGLSFAIPL
jgi:hypothetical protein